MVFIKKVYRYSKPLGIGMLFFVTVQLFCFYKGGMVFSPWYNYGMYSERINVKLSYEALKLDGISGNNYSPQAWDKIHYTAQQFWQIKKNDTLYETEIKRLFAKTHLFIPVKSKYTFKVDSLTTSKWILKYLTSIDSKFAKVKGSADFHYLFNGDSLIRPSSTGF